MKKQILSVFLASAMLTGSIPMCAASAANNASGDVNGDGKLSISDVVMLSRYVGEDASVSLTMPANADINGDGSVDFNDATAMLRTIARLPLVENISASRNLMDDVTANSIDIVEYSDAFKDSQMNFAVKMLQETVKENQQKGNQAENLLISPTSAMFALAMTANGAKEDTLAQMEQVLGGGMDIDELNRYLYTFREKTTKSGQFSVANGIWFRNQQNGVPFEPQTKFIQNNADFYGAGAFASPFDRSTVEEMNDFINLNTHEMIPQFFPEFYEIPQDTMMYLVNTLAFESRWQKPYLNGYNTTRHAFTCYNGNQIIADMMSSTEWTYLSDENACGFIKPYEFNEFSFAALVPDEGVSIDEYVASLTGEKLTKILKNSSNEEVYTVMPMFSYDYDISLNNTLQNMGMTNAFQDYLANFDGIDNGLFDLYINEVKQKTHITVDTDGTQAAAVTVIDMPQNTGDITPDPKLVYLERPFVYMIIDNSTNVPLFMGTMLKPNGAIDGF